MMVKWFGTAPWGPICLDAPRVEIPVGDNCEWCDEEFVADDYGMCIPAEYRPWHQECYLRSVFGSAGHQVGDCECHGKIDKSEDGLTRRQAARNSVTFFRLRVQSGMIDGLPAIPQKPDSVN